MNVSKASLNWRDAGGMLITASNNSTKQTKIMKNIFEITCKQSPL